MENPSKITPLHLLQVGVRKRRMPPMHGGWVTLQALEFEHRGIRGIRGTLGKPGRPTGAVEDGKNNGCGCRRNGAGGESWGKKSVKVGESG